MLKATLSLFCINNVVALQSNQQLRKIAKKKEVSEYSWGESGQSDDEFGEWPDEQEGRMNEVDETDYAK